VSLDDLRTGSVIRFPYLWVREAERGETEDRKPSFYLGPEPPLGRFSKAFFLPLMRQFIDRRSSIRGVNRNR
jgi:hypothetical protein